MIEIINFFNNSRLHDYELGLIQVDYVDSRVKIQFKNPQGKICEITIKDIISFYISHEEEWGEGKYIVASDVRVEDNIYIVEFQLNSGDICIINVRNKLSAG